MKIYDNNHVIHADNSDIYNEKHVFSFLFLYTCNGTSMYTIWGKGIRTQAVNINYTIINHLGNSRIYEKHVLKTTETCITKNMNTIRHESAN